ncbi:MAG: hypothetical protein ACOCXX_03920 [Planctomycetota bacterium]
MMSRAYSIHLLCITLVTSLLTGCSANRARTFKTVPACYAPGLDHVAVAPMVNRSGHRDALQSAQDALVQALGQSGTLTVLTPDKVHDLAGTDLLKDARNDPWELLDLLRRNTEADTLLLTTLVTSSQKTHRLPMRAGRAGPDNPLVTVHECAVGFTARLIRVSDGLKLLEVNDPLSATVVGSAPEDTPANCIERARHDAAHRLVSLVAPTPARLMAEAPPAVRLSTGLVDNRWQWTDHVAPTTDKATLVVTLPDRFNLMRFRLVVARAGSPEVLWEHPLTWTSAYDSFGWSVPIGQLRTRNGPGRYVATLHSGTASLEGGEVDHTEFTIEGP